MLKLLKYLKKSTIALIFVTALLVLQAYCDLSLPAYTSKIINVGIMQGGLESSVPNAIRASELEKLSLFLNDKDNKTVLEHYTQLKNDNGIIVAVSSSSNPIKDKEASDYLKKYPALKTEPLYIWDNKEEASLKEILSIPMVITYGVENGNETVTGFMKQMMASMPKAPAKSNMDLITVLKALPKEGRVPIIDKLTQGIQKMPDMLRSQGAVSYVKQEYKAIGISVNKLQTNYLISVGLKMIGLALVAMMASIIVTYCAARIAARMGRDLRSMVFHKVLSFSNTEMDKFSTASLITRSTNDIQQVQMLIVMMIRIVIYSPILAFGGIIKVLNTNTSMTWTLGLGVGVIFVLIAVLMIIALPKFKLMQKLIDRINLVMREILTGLPVIRAFSTEKHEEKRFDKANIDLTKNSLFVNRVMTFLMPALMLIMNLVSILIIWVGAGKINNGTMQVGDMMAFIQYTMQIIISFLMLTMISIVLPRAGISAKRIDEIISTKESIQNPEQEELPSSDIKGLLEFQNVNFRYPNADEDVLSGISFTAKPGETTAIIGSTGSGKTTLVNLIPRFYDVNSGNVLVDGLDIRKMSQHTLRDKLGFVPQKGVLFSGTIESNISFGKPDASQAEITAAAQIAQADEFIDEKPEKYGAPIAEGGTNVSGGQKQRLSIARAIAKHPEIYIFDDSFSALDYKTDAALRKAMKEKLSGSTAIIVAQRISTIMNAEQILVLDEGRIVGKGTHKELLKTCDVYQQIASSQLSKEELEYE